MAFFPSHFDRTKWGVLPVLNEAVGFPQNLPSICVAHALLSDLSIGSTRLEADCPPVPVVKVLDMCSAPGGKATHCAEILQRRGLAENGSFCVAVDRSKRKVIKVGVLSQKRGVGNLVVNVVGDSSNISGGSQNHNNVEGETADEIAERWRCNENKVRKKSNELCCP